MAERMDKQEVVSFEELLISNMYEQEALVLLLEEKGILTRGEVLEKVKELRVAKRAEVE
ncbi:MAG: hypothetical protein V3S24_11035 [Candidatus Tectomicrobia bacterium]